MEATAARRRRRKEARPGEIVAAALEVFAEKGFAATRLEDVAERANIGKGTIYLYFDTKEALFEAAVYDVINPLLERVGAASQNEDATCTELLCLVIEGVYADLVGTQRRQIMRMLIAEAGRFPELVAFYYENAVGRGKALIRTIVDRGVARGEFREGPATRYPEVVLGPAIMAAVWKMIFDALDPMDLDRFRAAHIDLILHGLRADNSSP